MSMSMSYSVNTITVHHTFMSDVSVHMWYQEYQRWYMYVVK